MEMSQVQIKEEKSEVTPTTTIIKPRALTLSSIPEPGTVKSSYLSPEVVDAILKKWKENPMTIPRLVKVTVNIGVGQSGDKLHKAARVLEFLTGQKPAFRHAKKTIKEFGIRRGENIAVMVTLRGEKALSFLKKALYAVNYTLKASSFDEFGNVAFGIREHIALPGVKYDPEIGIFGMDIALTLERPGFRIIRRRRCKKSRIPRRHRVSREEAILFLELLLGVRIAPR